MNISFALWARQNIQKILADCHVKFLLGVCTYLISGLADPVLIALAAKPTALSAETA
jgi:hypothetical protein